MINSKLAEISLIQKINLINIADIQMSSNTNQNIYPKSCGYGCGLQIYWNTSENTYFEVLSQKKHICPNRTNNKSVTSNTSATIPGVSANKPTYYSRKPWSNTPKPKMSNSLELLQGSIAEIQQKYEILSDIVSAVSIEIFIVVNVTLSALRLRPMSVN